MFRILALRRQMLILDIAAEACPDKRRKMGEENVLDEIVEMLDATFHQSSKTLFSEVEAGGVWRFTPRRFTPIPFARPRQLIGGVC